MKLTNKEVVSMLNCIAKLMNTQEKASRAFSFALVRNHEKLLEVYKSFEIVRDSVVNEYGSITEKGQIKVNPGMETELQAELEKLLSIETEFSFQLFKLEDCPESVSPEDMLTLSKFIEC